MSNNIAVNSQICLACGKCVDHCIMDNLRLVLPPCRQASPLGVNYQAIMRFAAAGRTADAARALRSSTPFGGFLAVWGDKAAAHACSRSRKGGALEFAGILEWLVKKEEALVYGTELGPQARSGRKTAVIGSGAAGLQAAHDLRRSGYSVDVYEAAPAIGGTLLFQPSEGSSPTEADLLPPIPAEVLQKTVGMLTAMGISFHTFSPKGQADLDALRTEYDAVVCACGKGAALPADAFGRVEGNLFAAGACVKNQKQLTTLQALASGSKAAHAVRNLLEGFSEDYESDRRTALGQEAFHGLSAVQAAMPDLPPVHAARGIFGDEEAKEEAGRCLGCGSPEERNMTCWYCLPCEVVCPVHALHVRIPYLVR